MFRFREDFRSQSSKLLLLLGININDTAPDHDFFVPENPSKFIVGLSVVNDHADTMSALSISRHQKISRNRFRLFKYSFKDQLELFDN